MKDERSEREAPQSSEEALVRHLENASKIVSTWPAWKQALVERIFVGSKSHFDTAESVPPAPIQADFEGK